MKVELRQINLSYIDKHLFTNFNLTVESGQKVWISAPSGCGKSTILNMIAGFVLPDAGSVYIDNVRVSGENIRDIRKHIGLINQNADLPPGNVTEVLDEVFSYEHNLELGIRKAEIENTVANLHFDTNFFQKSISDLSGGERQRLAFAILLLMNRKIWLLDEVTSGLDSKNRQIVANLIMESGATVILTSHDSFWESTTLKKYTIYD
jgi:putative ABC transport system ATP-binding protein